VKILFVIDSLGHGGAERSLVELVPALRVAGVEVVIVPLEDRGGPLTGEATQAGATVVPLRPGSLAHRTLELRRIVRHEHPTIVHTTLFLADQVGRVAAYGTGAIVVSSLVNTIYDPVRLQDPNVRRHRLTLARVVDGWTARHLTTHLHAISHAVAKSCSRAMRITPDRITVVERGRDPTRLGEPGPDRRRRARATLGLSDDAQVVVTVGRQEFQKGQEFLLNAFDRIATAHPRAVLLVAGAPGRATARLESLHARSEHAHRIHFLGWREDVPELLAAADVFAFPSRYEGFGGALVEAMALAIPAVVSDLPALREVARDAALYVPRGDTAALAAALARLLDDPTMAAQLGARARSLFQDCFTAAHSSAGMLELYARVSGRPIDRGAARATAFPRPPPRLVSVVVPVLNEVADLPEQLAGLAAQTYCGPWELIVCDNGSDDGTVELAASWRSRLPQLRTVDASDRRGLNHARNVGVAHARGDFVAFCDGDDVVDAAWLAALVAAAPVADIVGGAVPVRSLGGPNPQPKPVPDRLPTKHDFLLGVSGGNCGVWRDVATALGWDERFLFGGSDIEFSWRAQLGGYRIAYAPEAVVDARAPDDLGALARQWYRYGESGATLFLVFRHCGMARSRTVEAVRVWAWLLLHLGDLSKLPDARREWVRVASYRVGRLAGSIRERTRFL